MKNRRFHFYFEWNGCWVMTEIHERNWTFIQIFSDIESGSNTELEFNVWQQSAIRKWINSTVRKCGRKEGTLKASYYTLEPWGLKKVKRVTKLKGITTKDA